MEGKVFSLFFEQIGDDIKVQFNEDKKCAYMSMAELVLSDSDENYNEKVLSISDVIGKRYIKSGLAAILLTCITSRGLSTMVMVFGRDRDETAKELEVVCSLIESATQGSITCSPLNKFSELIKNCLGSLSPIDYLTSILLKNRKNVDVVIPHPVSVNPLYNLYRVRDYEYLSSILSRGNIAIGRLYTNPNIIVTISDEHLLRHVVIVGSTGSGKSTTAAILSEKSAENGYAVVVIDWHGEYENLLQYAKDRVIYTNPMKGLIPEPLGFDELIKHEPLSFIEILESSLELTPAQAHILEDAVNLLTQQRLSSNLYYIDTIIDIIQNSSASARWFAESREALLRKLKPLSSMYLNIKWNRLQRVQIERGKILIFDASSISNTRVRRILSALLIRSVILKAQYNSIEKPLLIVVDEAHNLFQNENPLSTLVAEVRKWSVGFVIITQAPSMLASVVLKNANTKVIHTLKSSSDVETVLSMTNLRKEYKKIISALKPGEALLTTPELIEPVMVKICRI